MYSRFGPAGNMEEVRRRANSGLAGLYVISTILTGSVMTPVDPTPASAAIIQQDVLELPEALRGKYKVQPKIKPAAEPAPAPAAPAPKGPLKYLRVRCFLSYSCDSFIPSVICAREFSLAQFWLP